MHAAGLSYVLLLDLGANFFRYFVSKNWHDQCLWGGAAQVRRTSLAARAQHVGAHASPHSSHHLLLLLLARRCCS
jgi:hypothetical protein